MTPAGIEPATFRFVEQHLSHCATAVPQPHRVETQLSRNPGKVETVAETGRNTTLEEEKKKKKKNRKGGQ